MYSDKILTTYQSRIDELSPTKKFHFLSRLNLIIPSDWSRSQIESMGEWFFGKPAENRLLELGQATRDPLHLNAATERLPLFKANPWLFGYELQLFHVLHAKVQYKADVRSTLNMITRVKTDDVDALSHNPHKLAVLATYLVDVYYLHHRLMLEDETKLIPLTTVRDALTVTLSPTDKARLNVYLLTHCIIGETLFYARPIPTSKLEYYQKIAGILIRVAQANWNELTIDSKLEVALCLQLTDTASTLVGQAVAEAEDNYNDHLGYIVDSKMPHKNDLEWAEHRNVLYLLVASKLN